MTESQKQIQLTDVGPIASLRIPIPAEGGCVVLHGRNGSGKSTALESIRAAVGGKAKLEARDGSAKGTVEAFGAKITVAGNQRRRGEVEVVSLEGRGDVAALVDPGIDDAVRADAARVRAIVALSGRSLSAADFTGLLASPEEWAEIVGEQPSSDPLELAGRVKRAIESAARTAAKEADDAGAMAAAYLRQNVDVDLSAPSDAGELAEAYAAARARHAEAVASVGPAEAAERRRAEAAAALERLPPGSFCTDQLETAARRIVELAAAKSKLADGHAAIMAEIDALEARLVSLRHSLDVQEAKIGAAMADMRAAESDRAALADRIADRARLEAVVAEPVPEVLGAEQLAELASGVERARQAMTLGAKVREAVARQAKAGECTTRATAAGKLAQRLRDAAAGVDDVLTGLVADLVPGVRIEDGRLVTDTRRGRTLFADLSHGERWRLALEFAIGAVGRGGVLVCPQEAWEGLDPRNRAAVADQLSGTGVVMFTAACSSDAEIEAEVVK